jgi:LacI family transcriptional regulator
MIRLKDIAEKAGVSVMTVSKVLRDAPDIAAGTKARIRLLATQMGYVPDTMAQGLRTRKTKLVGLVYSAITNPVFPRILLAVEDCVLTVGYDLIIGHSLNDPQREATIIHRMMSRRVDGLIVSPYYRMADSIPIYDELLASGIPTVIIGQRRSFCSQFSNVEIGDLDGSLLAMRHLLGLGHRRIAFFAGMSVVPSAQDRLEGYRRALREAQIEPDDRLVFNAGGTIEEGRKAAEQFLAEAPGATAVLAVNDLVAMGAGTVFLERGLKIPEDISLVGFGNVLASEYFRVPLTTLSQPKHRVGCAAVESLMQLIRGEKPETRHLPMELKVRSSTAPPKPAPAPAT